MSYEKRGKFPLSLPDGSEAREREERRRERRRRIASPLLHLFAVSKERRELVKEKIGAGK